MTDSSSTCSILQLDIIRFFAAATLAWFMQHLSLLISAVKDHAKANYNVGGQDYVVCDDGSYKSYNIPF